MADVSFVTPTSLEIAFGKRIGDNVYLHASALTLLPLQYQELVAAAARLAGVQSPEQFNVVRFDLSCENELSLLYYIRFFDDAFPALGTSWRVSLDRGVITFRNYEESRNPPVLHRKELLLPPEDSRARAYAELTNAAERIGLFSEPSRIGFREHWMRLITERGYQLVGSEFVPLANAIDTFEQSRLRESAKIRRHLTALARANFSAPVQALSRSDLLSPHKTFFDYGCGRGDDVRGLIANGIDATGWDPHYSPENDKRVADVTNIGFVINVIEDLTERIEALKGAYKCARGVLCVAAMLTSQMAPEGRPYRDGYISSRNTFQKYFTQSQLRDFIEHILDETAIAAGPGVFFVFRDKTLEQRFLATRYGRRESTTLSRGWVQNRPRAVTRQKPTRISQLVQANQAFFDALWTKCLAYGRTPGKEEIGCEGDTEVPQEVGSLAKALRILKDAYDDTQLKRASAARTADILVVLALQQFEQRKPYRHLEPRLKRDIRHFFGDYANAELTSRQILFRIGTRDAINEACREAAGKGYGHLEEGHSLQVHVSLVARLPPLLRVYVGCATLLYGDVSEFDLIKIHISSGKVTLLEFDEFDNSPLPRLIRRVKVKLRDQDMAVFDYGADYPPPLLYHKSRYINEESPTFSEQVAFEEALDALALFDLNGYGPAELEFFQVLERARWQIEGFALVRSRRIPTLDEPCGANFTYRQLIQCGDTQQRTAIANLPIEPESYTALYELAKHILDPLIEYFGMITLTYGFCSAELARCIPLRIAPHLDQHAGHERKSTGAVICPRLGAAVDFIVRDENMQEVASWIDTNVRYDRLYFYGDDRPIHVSYGPNQKRKFVEMIPRSDGRRMPRIRRTTR